MELNLNVPSFAIVRKDTPAANDHTSAQYKQVSKNGEIDYLLLSPPNLSEIPTELRKRAITTVRYYVYVTNVVNDIQPRIAKQSFNPNTITLNDIYQQGFTNYFTSAYDVWSENYSDGRRKGTGWGYISYNSTKENNSFLLHNGSCLYLWDYPVGSEKGSINTSKATSNKPYVKLYLSDEDWTPTVVANDKKTGFIDRHIDNVFRWTSGAKDALNRDYASSSYLILDETLIDQTSATFEWKTDPDATPTAVELFGDTKEYTLPAETIQPGAFYWRVTSRNGLGTATTEWYQLNPNEATSTCKLYINGKTNDNLNSDDPDNVLSWTHIITTGSQPTGTDIQIKYAADPDTTWRLLAHVDGPDLSYVIPPKSLTDGNYNLRARTYNTDSIAGSWSTNNVLIVVQGPPSVPGVNSFDSIKPTVTWSSGDHLAHTSFEVMIDGVTSGEIFGSENSYDWKEYLPAGAHDVAVRVKNRWSLWSEWGTAVGVSNYDGPTITLSITNEADSGLEWTTSGDYRFILYKNGRRIYSGPETVYFDLLSEPGDEYYVLGLNADYAALSDTMIAHPVWNDFRIASLDKKRWLVLKYASVQYAEQNHSRSRTAVYRHFSGSVYPSIEISSFSDEIFAFQAAFMDPEDIKAFEDLIGDVVCLRTQHGETIVGGLMNVTESRLDMYTVFKAEIRKIDYDWGLDP